MTIQEIISNFLLPVIAAAVTGLAGFIGMQLKKIYQKHVDDKTKEAVVRTCVKAVEQLYHDLGGPEKLEKAKEKALAAGVNPGIDPFMTLSFLSLPVIPELRLTTRGVFDVSQQKYI